MSATEALDAYLERQQSSKKASSSARAAGKQQEPPRAATNPPARLSRASESAPKSRSMAKGPQLKAGAPRADDRARDGAIKAVWPPSPLDEKDDRPLLAKAHPATARTAQRKPSETASKDQVSGLHHADHLQGPWAGHVVCNSGQLHQAACTYGATQLWQSRPAPETLAARDKIASPCCEECKVTLPKQCAMQVGALSKLKRLSSSRLRNASGASPRAQPGSEDAQPDHFAAALEKLRRDRQAVKQNPQQQGSRHNASTTAAGEILGLLMRFVLTALTIIYEALVISRLMRAHSCACTCPCVWCRQPSCDARGRQSGEPRAAEACALGPHGRHRGPPGAAAADPEGCRPLGPPQPIQGITGSSLCSTCHASPLLLSYAQVVAFSAHQDPCLLRVYKVESLHSTTGSETRR